MEPNKIDTAPENDDAKHAKHHFWQKRHAKEKEIASNRGEAAAYATMGAVGGLGSLAAESIASATGAAIEIGFEYAAQKAKQTTWKKVAAVTGLAAAGALVYAGVKHLHAEKLEAELKEKDNSHGHQL